MPRTLVVIPARLAASRLPGKPLADIHGKPMIVHVWARAREADVGDVVVATDTPAIADAVRAAGGEAVMTRDDHPSGSDRVWEAVTVCEANTGSTVDLVLNLQGDLPTLAPSAITACRDALLRSACDLATIASPIHRDDEHTNPNVVKVIGTPIDGDDHLLRALYFTRATAPSGPGVRYHHIGIYMYRREALRRFVELPPSGLERRERLEQLRALEAGMTIGVGIVDDVPLGVDAPDDLERARALLKP